MTPRKSSSEKIDIGTSSNRLVFTENGVMNLKYLMKQKKRAFQEYYGTRDVGYFSNRLARNRKSGEKDGTDSSDESSSIQGYGTRKASCRGIENSHIENRPKIGVRSPSFGFAGPNPSEGLNLALNRNELDQNISRNKFTNGQTTPNKSSIIKPSA